MSLLLGFVVLKLYLGMEDNNRVNVQGAPGVITNHDFAAAFDPMMPGR